MLDQLTAVDYICPKCTASELSATDTRLTCGRCSTEYEIRNGIPVFQLGDAEFQWDVSFEPLKDLPALADEVGWHDAFMTILSEMSPRDAALVWNRTLGPRRLAMTMLLPLTPEARVLDMGSGWGTISMNLARQCGEVVSFDQIPGHLDLQKAMCDALDVRNISFVQGGNLENLPFPSDHFDAAILNGVLEWAASNSEGDPQVVQTKLLSEMARILKPSGVLYVGIENRWNHKYFQGTREGHIRMKYGALLPRKVTDWYLRTRRGRPYREYTYTLFGYRKILSDAGLKNRRFYSGWPHYSSIQHVLPHDKEGDESNSPWTVESDNQFADRPVSYFARTYLMTATPGTPTPVVLDRVVSDVAERMGWVRPMKLTDQLFSVTSSGKAIVKVQDQSGSKHILRIGLVRNAGEDVANHGSALQGLAEKGLADEVARYLPSLELSGEVDGFAYSLERQMPGEIGRAALDRESTLNMLCGDVSDFLTGLWGETATRVTVDSEVFARYFAEPIQGMRDWFTDAEWRDHVQWFSSVEDALARRVIGQEIVLGPKHGDLVPDNCLIERSGSLRTVLDWDLYSENRLPLYDWIMFLANAYRPQIKHAAAGRGLDPESEKFNGYPAIFMSGGLKDQLYEHADRIGVDSTLVDPLLFMWWVTQMSDWKPLRLYDPEWRKMRLFPLIERLRPLAEAL